MKRAIIATICLMATSTSQSADWHATYKNDEMRGTSTKFLQTDSDNSVEFDFPYSGGSNLTLVLRSKKTQLKKDQKPDDLPVTEALLIISKGQFSCSSYDGCSVSVKFDDGKIQKYSMSGAEDSSSDVIFFDKSSSFIKGVKSHKKMIIEASFFQEGDKQFKFDLTGIEKPKA